MGQLASKIKEDRKLLAPLLEEADAKRGFFDKIGESYSRGKASIFADIAFYDAIFHNKGNPAEIWDIKNRLAKQRKIDPIKGNALANLVYASAEMLPGWIEGSKKAVPAALAGAATGGGIALALGQTGPQAIFPEEAATVPIGIIKGAKTGYILGSSFFWYKQGAGAMLSEMMKRGYDPEISKKIAVAAAIPYAAIEFFQLKGLKPAFRVGAQKVSQRAFTKVLANAAKKYGKTLGTEVLEEMLQEGVQIAAEDIAGYLSKKGVKIDEGYLKDRVKRMYQTTTGATKALALLPLPGAALETSIDYAVNEQAATRKKSLELDKPADKFAQSNEQLTTKDKFSNILITAANTWEETVKVRKVEKGLRFGEAENILADTNSRPNVMHRFKAAFKALAGKYKEFHIDPLTDLGISENNVVELSEQINFFPMFDKTQKMTLWKSLMKFYNDGKVPVPSEMTLYEQFFGEQTAKAIEFIREKTGAKKSNIIVEIAGFSKSTLASADLSHNFRQSAYIAVRHPKLAAKGLANAFKFFTNEKFCKDMDKKLRTDPDYPLAQQANLIYNAYGEFATQKQKSEFFPSKIASQMPVIKQSERAFVMTGNFLRFHFFKMWLNKWRNSGIDIDKKMLKDLGHISNILTGEGDVKWLGKHAETLSLLFFSPRFLASRVQIIQALFDPRLSIPARKIIAQNVASYVIGVGSLIGLIAMSRPNIKVERDPRSTEFMKLRIGNTRIDPWAGMQPLIRYTAQLITAESKTRAGKVLPAKRAKTIAKFAQSKFAPLTGLIADIIAGQTFYGEAMSTETKNIAEQIYQRLTPLFIQDVIDSMRFQGVSSGLYTAPLAFTGVGVQSYPVRPSTEVALEKNRVARETFGVDWESLGPETQELMRLQNPIIEQKEKESKATKENFNYIARAKEKQFEAGKKVFESLPLDVQNEMTKLNVTIGGLSRALSTNWILNDKRYKKYQDLTSKLLNSILPTVIDKPGWSKLNPIDRQMILETLISKVKSAVRQHIISNAKVEDFQRLKGGLKTIL